MLQGHKNSYSIRAGKSVLQQQSAAVRIILTQVPKIRFVSFQEHEDTHSSLYVAVQ